MATPKRQARSRKRTGMSSGRFRTKMRRECNQFGRAKPGRVSPRVSGHHVIGESTGSFRMCVAAWSGTDPPRRLRAVAPLFSKGRFGHPIHNRTISVREAALLQTFPADYRYPVHGACLQHCRQRPAVRFCRDRIAPVLVRTHVYGEQARSLPCAVACAGM